MTWLIRWGGKEYESDDFTLDDLDAIEKATEEPWSTLNPLRSARTAKEFLRVVLRKAGEPEDMIDTLTLRTIKSAFDYRPDIPVPGAETGEDDVPLDLSSPSSSAGAADGSTGPRRKSAPRRSVTSSP